MIKKLDLPKPLRSFYQVNGMADRSARNYLVLGSMTPQQPQEKWYTQELKELSDIEYEPDEHTTHFGLVFRRFTNKNENLPIDIDYPLEP